MKKLSLVLLVLALVSMACGLQKVTPTPVPPKPQNPENPTLPPLNTEAPAPTAKPPEVQVQPTKPEPVAVPAETELLYSDDFSQKGQYWTLNSNDDFKRDIRDGHLVLTIGPTMKDMWIALEKEINVDVEIEVDVTQLAGVAKSDFGVVCGLQDRDNFFALTAGPNGYVELFKYVNGNHLTITEIDYAPGIKSSATNHLKATCQGSTLRLEVNGELVAQATDTNLKPGLAGLVIGTFDEGNASFAFDDLVIRKAGSGSSTSSDSEIPRGTLLYSDDFKGSSTEWDDYAGDTSKAGPSNGSYNIIVRRTQYEAFANPYRHFDDGVVVDVDATVMDGHDENGFGVICGYQDVDDFFAVLVGTQGYAEIVRYTSDGRETLVDKHGVSVGQLLNHVTGVCKQKQLTLYVNGQMVLSTSHPDLQAGDVGLIAGTFDSAPVEVRFENFEVYKSK